MNGQAPVREPVQCSAKMTLTEAERRVLNAMPHAMNVAAWHHTCELEDAHRGPHHALGQSQDSQQERWLRWDDRHLGQVEFVDLAACEYRGENGELCTLFAEHPGAHHLADHPWATEYTVPPPDPDGNHIDYLAHRRAALTSATTETAQLHASLALAAATNRVADLLDQQRNPGR